MVHLAVNDNNDAEESEQNADDQVGGRYGLQQRIRARVCVGAGAFVEYEHKSGDEEQHEQDAEHEREHAARLAALGELLQLILTTTTATIGQVAHVDASGWVLLLLLLLLLVCQAVVGRELRLVRVLVLLHVELMLVRRPVVQVDHAVRLVGRAVAYLCHIGQGVGIGRARLGFLVARVEHRVFVVVEIRRGQGELVVESTRADCAARVLVSWRGQQGSVHRQHAIGLLLLVVGSSGCGC